jgi:hypothetical protein
MNVVLGLLVVIAAICGVVVSTATLAGWLVVRRIRRFRRSVPYRRGTLLVRTVVAPSSAARRVTRLRVELFEAVTATRQVLSGTPAPAILQQLAFELQRSADVTDARLELLSREPDADLLRSLLPELESSTAQLRRSAADIRATAWQFSGVTDRVRAESLVSEVADQVAGLQAGLHEVQRIRAQRMFTR